MPPFRAFRPPAPLLLAWLVAGLALAGLPAAPALAQQGQPPNREFTVQNETDLTLRELYAAPPNATDRGPDRLGADTVAPGANFRVRLGRLRDCTLDVTAVYQDGSEEVRRRVDICRNQRLVFGDPSVPVLEVTVANRSQVMLRELYAARAGAAARGPGDWGPDRLGAAVIDANAEFRMRIRSRDCVFDIRAVYADDREEVRERADLCVDRSIAFDRSTIPAPPRHPLLLVNRHLATVQEIYVSASTESDWGPDRLRASPLPVGDEAATEVEGACEVDIRIVFPNGGAEERREVDICASDRIVLRPAWVLAERLGDEGAVPAPPGEAGLPLSATLRIRNAGRLPIVEIYAAPPGAPRGEDRLGTDILPAGDTFEIGPPDADACAADLVAVFRDGREVTRAGVDLCSGEEIEIR
ncbi:hypothetical protein [Falsiroseomonas sp. CW058]|uniref:hypothetical protein n=1 Tax=Falsiroseomonas sp. CW058 TaxID=3388664 RepID=UPI003D315541